MIPIYAPESFWRATPEQIKEVCNGCGAKDGIKVPDTMWFLCIILACQIHDWMFKEGKTIGDYFYANAIFFFNLAAIIINGSNWLTLLPRMSRAVKYFIAVMTEKGQEAFWADKLENKEISISFIGSFKKMEEIPNHIKEK